MGDREPGVVPDDPKQLREHFAAQMDLRDVAQSNIQRRLGEMSSSVELASQEFETVTRAVAGVREDLERHQAAAGKDTIEY